MYNMLQPGMSVIIARLYIIYISQDMLYIVYISLEAFKKISLMGALDSWPQLVPAWIMVKITADRLLEIARIQN